ncbi:hypothetical protein NXC14_PB00601 (plasmid) [Rhizobium sp. NXC14]|nr:hypothetical protein NXC14_PB00601 [Rhizobium sp. NXC14]
MPRATPSAGIIRFRFEGFFSARLSTNAPVSHHALFRREWRGCHSESEYSGISERLPLGVDIAGGLPSAILTASNFA